MSNYAIGVGGSGAKLMQTMLHLGASGAFPADRRSFHGLLVDPDENNGNVADCLLVEASYQACRKLPLGQTDLFSAYVDLAGPWTPTEKRPAVDTLKAIFHYDQLARDEAPDADLLDLLFEEDELTMPIKQGFRGRPAIGATVFAHAIDFSEEESVWGKLAAGIRQAGAQTPRAILAGSVFGGSGASGVPTIVRLLEANLKADLPALQLALILLLPYFQFEHVPDEPIQADPANFPAATAEALGYYHDQGFLSYSSIYAVGEEIPAMAAVPAIGAALQKNDPHFVELIAGLGAIQFFSGRQQSDTCLAVAARETESTVTWDDLPLSFAERKTQVARLQKMAVFAVAFNYIFYPMIVDILGGRRAARSVAFWHDHVEKAGVSRDDAGNACATVHTYLNHYLNWLLHLSVPRREGFHPGLVDPNVFAIRTDNGWRLKKPEEFQDKQFADLILSRSARLVLDSRALLNNAGRARVEDPAATQGGRLIRALFDACSLD